MVDGSEVVNKVNNDPTVQYRQEVFLNPLTNMDDGSENVNKVNKYLQ